MAVTQVSGSKLQCQCALLARSLTRDHSAKALFTFTFAGDVPSSERIPGLRVSLAMKTSFFLQVLIGHLSFAALSSLGASIQFSQASVATATAGEKAPLAPIATPTPESSTFQYVKDVICDTPTVNRVYQIYSKNRNLFDQCVVDGDYQIFPHTGIYPNSAQIRALVESPPCIAVFTAVLLADIPACDLGGTPMRSAAETMLMLKVDIVDNGRKPPTSAHFKQILVWRHAVNLAQAAGAPYDGYSQLYAEYTRNLWTALTKTSVQVFLDLSVVFILPNGTISRGSPARHHEGPGFSDDSSSGSSVSDTVYLDEENDVAVKVTVSSPLPTPSPSPETVFTANQSLDTVSKQQASASARSGKPTWWLGTLLLALAAAVLGC